MTIRQLLAHAVAVGTVAAVSMTGLTGTASAAAASGDHLSRGETLNAGQFIERSTSTGHVKLIMQSDGNLVEYGRYFGVCWATHTENSGGAYATYQTDGNLVIYTAAGRAVWASNTVGSVQATGSTVDMNNAGQLYIGTRRFNDGCR
ncbi:hypothetical protein [Streptomyces sp. NBC_00239]|uniref:hypothetical protein n=1 Tax=Streptomyces sp. NBC_00239 TaxID=2903640 RepID=UPI002E29EFEE|nr:hypothetical protein [Streptomyces sp. NBC_00239]